MVDEHTLVAARPDTVALPAVVLYAVDDAVPVARTSSDPVVVAGSVRLGQVTWIS